MKNIKYIKNMAISGAFMLLTATVISCVDINEWETDSQYDRLFSPSSLSVTASTTSADITWSATPNTNYYIIEVSTDSLYGKAESPHESSMIYGMQKNITKSPFAIGDLNSNTKYFIRVMACSDNEKENSHWNYPEKFSFTTKSENIFNAVSTQDRGEDYIRLSWEAGLAVTKIDYAEVTGVNVGNTELGEIKTVQLSDDNKTEGYITITDLKASTSYQFTIYNNDHIRGTRVATTKIETPDANYIATINAGTTLTQEMLNSWADKGSVTVKFEAGAEYILTGIDVTTGEPAGLTIPNNLSITFFGTDGDSKAVLNMAREVIMGGAHSYIRFRNVIINDGGAQYLFNQGVNATSEEVSFVDCELNNFARSVIRFKDQKSISVDQISFDNCIITNQGSGSYAFITLDAKEYTVGNIEFTNTTFNTLQHTGIALFNSGRGCAKVSTTSFNNCTFYNCIGAARYILDDGNTSQGPAVTFNNTIIAKTFAAILADGIWTSKSKGIRTSSVTLKNTYLTVDGIFETNQLKDYLEYSGTSNDLFKDPVNGNFTIKDSNFPANIGASRWFAE